MEVRKERTGWRDEAISRRHREWGYDLPITNIDFLVVDYDRAKPVAIIEYKHERALLSNTSSASYRAIGELCNLANIPFFVVQYKGDFTIWTLIPVNKKAREIIGETKKLSEYDYVDFLYKLRGRVMPDNIAKILKKLIQLKFG
jgi:hypothetical protein